MNYGESVANKIDPPIIPQHGCHEKPEGARKRDTIESRLSDSTGYLVRQTHQAFIRLLELRLSDQDISISMWFFLRLLRTEDGRSQKELSQLLGLAQPTTVNMMDNLEKRGLIRRIRNAEDRRVVNIFLTRSGRKLANELVQIAESVNSAALATLNTKQTSDLRSLLNEVKASLESEIEILTWNSS